MTIDDAFSLFFASGSVSKRVKTGSVKVLQGRETGRKSNMQTCMKMPERQIPQLSFLANGHSFDKVFKSQPYSRSNRA